VKVPPACARRHEPAAHGAAHAAPTNVAQVRQLSPFRYPGGKTWLVPEIRRRLITARQNPALLVEPFAGGAMVGLSVAAEGLAKSVVLSELDDDVAAVWRTIFHGRDADVQWLRDAITGFAVNEVNVRAILDRPPTSDRARAFRTIMRNRMQRGGIMAAGAGLIRAGENGRGLHSRWYPETLAARIDALRRLRSKVTFEQRDAFEVIERFASRKTACFFVDPPYTAGGKRAGTRLYTHSTIDHQRLFATLAAVKGAVIMSYDDTTEVRELAARHGFRVETVPMKNTHHTVMRELVISKP